MDISMQVSLSETFNIVACDSIAMGVPVIGSTEIPWMYYKSQTSSATSSDKIADHLNIAYRYPKMNVNMNQRTLQCYVEESKKIWLKFVNQYRD